MKHLKRFNELNVAGTYLDKANITKSGIGAATGGATDNHILKSMTLTF